MPAWICGAGSEMARASRGMVAAKACVHALALTPAAVLAWQIRNEALTGSGGLGADPVASIEHRLGLWALRLLLVTLAITPLRQLTHKPLLVRFRRMLGLYAFFYATLHFGAYLVLDLRGYWTQVLEDIAKRPYITVGFTAWLLLVPLAITSTQAAIRRLGRNWARLHKLVYAIGVLAVLHFWWLVKSDVREPALYAGILAALLGWRLLRALRERRASGRRTATAG
jgi:sulfoxide reductase heme-binding subunit YedZ